MLEIVTSYHYKLINQTWENGKKTSFGPDFDQFRPKFGPQKFATLGWKGSINKFLFFEIFAWISLSMHKLHFNCLYFIDAIFHSSKQPK